MKLYCFHRIVWLQSLVLFGLLVPNGWTAFERERPGTRAAGMAGAFCAIADNADALVYNPAGLGQILSGALSFHHARLLTGLDDGIIVDNQLAYLHPISNMGSFGFSWYQRNLLDLYQEISVTLGYGLPLDEIGSYLLGGAVKVLHLSYQDQEAIKQNPYFDQKDSVLAFTADLGAMAYLTDFLTVGVALANITQPNMALEKDATSIVPWQWRIGSAFWFYEYVAAVDVLGYASDLRYAAGLEGKWFNNLLSARLGLGAGNAELCEVSAGLSIYLQQVNWAGQIDYAFIQPLNGFSGAGPTHQITLTFFFGEGLLDEDEVQGQKMLQLAEEAEQKGRWEEALNWYERAAELIPENETVVRKLPSLKAKVPRKSEVQWYLEQGKNYEKEKNYLSAAQAYRQVLERTPGQTEALQRLAAVEEKISSLTPSEKKRQASQEKQALQEEKRLNWQRANSTIKKAQTVLQAVQKNTKITTYFIRPLRKLQRQLQAAQVYLRQGDNETAQNMAQSILQEVAKLEEKGKGLEVPVLKVTPEALATKRVPEQEKTAVTTIPTPLPTLVPAEPLPTQPSEKGPASSQLQKRARGAYGRAVKLMLDIDQVNGQRYFPQEYQQFQKELAGIKLLLKSEDYQTTIHYAENLFPRLQKLKKACEEKDKARKAMPTNW